LIGAHPDDCELKAAGTCAKWIAAGYSVTLVSMTNGDAGHFEMKGSKLAQRRKRECAASAKRMGARSIVMDNHDGHLQPTVEVRKQVVRIIREAKADLVITHRPNDYHPDHRYTSQLVQDAAYMVTVPFFEPKVTSLRTNPVFMYFMDRFQKPYPFQADVAVAVDDVMPAKWAALDCHESQVYEWLAWHAGQYESVPKDPRARLRWLEQAWGPWFQDYAKAHRKQIAGWYGAARAAKVKYAECFEVGEYGRQPSEKELRDLFPFLPGKAGRGGKRKT
jgi:LmbE family N-acetylglucosaminyl deacetylase